MTRNRDDLSGSFETEDSGGWLTRFLADEDEFDRRAMWRLGSWAVGSVGAVVLAVLATQSSTQIKREQVAAADLARQAQLIQRVAKEAQVETNRLASAIDTLNGDRDRLFSRLGSLEQGLDSVTGSIAQQKAQPMAPPPAADKPVVAVTQPAASEPETVAKTATPAPPPISPVGSKPVTVGPAESKPIATPPVDSKPAVATPIDAKPVAAAPVESKSVAAAKSASEAPKSKPAPEQTIATASPPAPLMAPKSFMAPPDPAAAKLIETTPPASAHAAVTATAPEPDDKEPDPPAVPVQRTEFGIDLGGANSIDGLRALWQRLLKSNKVLVALRPIIMVKEKPAGGGMHLRLVAGPLTDAATAAKFCAILSGGDRFCETSVFDGQRLATGSPAAPSKPARKRNPQRATTAPEPAPELPKPPKPASLTSFLGIR